MSHPLITTAQSLIQANRLQQAREVLISVLEEDSQNAEALLALAAIEVREGKLHSGLECIDEVLRIAPDNPDALRERLLVQEKIKQQDNTTPEEMAPLPEGAKKPDFSIIIPVYNQVKYTKQCIETVQATCTNHTYEIIVIDDCSTDDTHVYLESVKDTVRSFRNRKNQGFILNCNFAASQARGEYIVLLNNDTIPQTNWLEGLLEPFTLFDKVAATGALMIHPDNKILEACSIVFSDGSGWNYGRGEDPDLPQYQYIREVDYVSGGGMMVPKKIWNELGGLDTYYCPAYYDDIDFCFRARRAGYKVLYTPFSRIIHFEGMTGGTDVTKGVKRYQLINQQKFNERWKDELAKQYENKFENVFRAARRESGKRILWIDHSLPLPNFNSGCLRMNNLLKSVLSLGHQVTYVALSNSDPGNYKTVMRKMGVETHTLNYERWEHSHDRDALIERALDMLNVGNNNYDIVYLSFYWVATLFIKKIRRRLPAAIIHVDSHDIHFLREKREAELYKTQEYARKAERTRIHELSVYSRADAIMTVTELDRQAILKELPNAVVMLMPNVHDDMPAETGFSERKDLLFVGGFNHTPNVDAMLCFCRTIFPKIKTVIPEIRLWIVGSNPTDEVKALANDSIMVTGWVDDTNPYLEKSRISIAPLRYGAGMKGKVGEAMSHGLPVITTPVGSEGMGIVHEEHALVVNSVDEWVDAIQKLYQDEALWNRLSQNGRELMRKNYGSDAMLDRARTVFGFQSRDEVAALSSCPSQRFFANGITSIVILTHNQLDYTKKCVRSIQENTPEPHEIVFVDNASRDGTVKWLRRLMHEHPNYLLIENSWNHGFARGCNQGIEASSGEHILLLNNDVVVTRGWLAGMMECLYREPDIGIVGPMTNSISGPQKVSTVDYTSLNGLESYAYNFRIWNRYRRIPNRRIVGFCMLFKRSMADDVGLLDEHFGMGNFEDDDYCLRAELLGYRNMIAGDVFIHHYGSQSFVGNRMNYGSLLSGNKKLFMNKWSAIDASSALGKRVQTINTLDTAGTLFRKGSLEQACTTLLEGIRQIPDEKRFFLEMAEMLVDAKQFSQAYEILSALPEDDHDTQRLLLQGYAEEGMGQDDRADTCVEKILALHPSNARAMNLKGILAHKKGNTAEAATWFNNALALDPGYAESYTNMGILKWATEKKQDAVALLEQGFVHAPRSADILASYQAAVIATNTFASAELRIREARDLFPDHRGITFFLIDVLLRQEKYHDAMQEIEHAMIQFGIDDGILAAALETRNKIGPLAISEASRSGSALSVCMIVKNEEHALPKCLMSIKPVANEIIVVDTGSDDRTREIATAFGAHVSEHAWTGDFSAARNEALGKASGDWILALDADEVIAAQDQQKLILLIARKTARKTAYSLITRNYVVPTYITGWNANEGQYPLEEAGTGWSGSIKVRLFPRDARIRFVNPVHELVEPSIRAIGMGIMDGGIPIHHYGKLDHEKRKSKAEDYYQLGRKKLKETGSSLDALKELAIQAGELKKYDEAFELWDLALAKEPNNAAAYVHKGSLYLELGNYTEALHASRRALELAPCMNEAVYTCSLCELYAGNASKAIALLEDMIRRKPDYPSGRVLLAMAYCCGEKKHAGLDMLKKSNGNGTGLANALYRAAKKLLAASQIEYAASLLDAAVESRHVNDDILRLYEKCRQETSSNAAGC